MLITRGAKPERDFAIIGNALLRDEKLSFRARGLLCCVLSHAEGYRVSSDRLAEMGTEGRDAIRRSLDELEASGYLIRTKSQDERGRWSSAAVITDAPTTEKPKTDFQSSVNQPSVFQALKEDKEEEKKKKVLEKPAIEKIFFDGAKLQNVSDEQSSLWAAAYPAIDVAAQILKAAAWLNANPANAKSDYRRFLNGWLSRAQDQAPRTGQPRASSMTANRQTLSFAERDELARHKRYREMTGRDWPTEGADVIDITPTNQRIAS